MSQPHLPNDHDGNFAEMMFGSAPRQVVPRPNPPIEVVQWGSDSNFGRHFQPQSEKETSEALEKERLIYMGCLEVNSSATNTRPSSPVQNGETSSPIKLRTRVSVSSQAKKLGDDDPDAPPRKRRKSKSKPKEESEETEEELGGPKVSGATARKRKSKIADSLAAASPVPNEEGAGKRRKSGANGASKPPRENLTEEQKRENHIKSEQKRRTLIKEGFDDLCDIVPGLKGGGFSKSTMLAMAAEWLEEMLRGNEMLKAQLSALEA